MHMTRQREIRLEHGERVVGIMQDGTCIAVRLEDSGGESYSWAMTDKQIAALRRNLEKVGDEVRPRI